jgi:hypothetical protein
MQSAYSWYGSRIHLVLEDEVADAYNRFLKAWYDAQVKHKEVHGKQWDPVDEPLLINYNDRDKEVYDALGNIINKLVELNGGGLEIPEEEMTSDYLVKL